MNILADASLPGLLAAFPKPFQLSFYHLPEEIPALLSHQHILLCRSTLKVNQQLLENTSISCVATASSGTDHIDTCYLKEKQIFLFDAKGSNAISVADYVLACIAFLQTERGFTGKKAGVIGVGEVGTEVLTRLLTLGMEVIGYDPLKQAHQFNRTPLAALFECDLLCIHANLHAALPYPSTDLLNAEFLNQLKPGTLIINAARGGIVNEKALLNTNKNIIYCTDVFLNEPQIDKSIVDFSTLCTPHIAGHSIEAKQAAVIILSEKLHQHYHLTPPIGSNKQVNTNLFFQNPRWQEKILSIFNPIKETIKLKQSINLQTDFIMLRKAHQYRHELWLTK